MQSSSKITCSFGATISKNNLKNHSKNNNLFVGTIYNNSNIKNEYLTILDFDLFNLDLNSFDTAFLNIYINDLKFANNNYILLSLHQSPITCKDLIKNQKFISKTNINSNLNIKINNNDINKYIKIDITSILISILSNKKNFSLIIKSLESLTTLISFKSFNSNNPPFIEIIKENQSEDFNYKLSCDINLINENISNILKQIENLNEEFKKISITPIDTLDS